MEIIDINNIDLQKSFFHFTSIYNLENITTLGLLPKIRNNAKGIETTEKIFFSIGITGVLQTLNVWIKWLINRVQREKYVSNANSKEEWIRSIDKFNEDFLSGLIFESRSAKLKVFDYMYNYMKNNVYLILKLEENIDFKYDDIDEAKVNTNQNNKRQYLNVLYGINEYQSTFMETWNMHTISGKVVEPPKIKVLSINDKTDALSIIKELFILNNNKDLNLQLLNEFINYINLREEESKDINPKI